MSNDNYKEPEQLEREVQAARDQLSHTVDEISNRLSPGELLDQALNVTKGYGGEFANNLGKQAKDNPLALMVTGVGMAWMMLGDQQRNNDAGTSYHTGKAGQSYAAGIGGNDQPEDAYHHATRGVVDVHNTGNGGESNSESLGEKLSHQMPDGEQLKGYAKSAQTQLQRTLEEQPLMAGALGVALGAALGALLPPSETEDRLMGATSDEMTDKATQVAAEQYENTKQTLEQKVSAATDQTMDTDQLTDNSHTDNS